MNTPIDTLCLGYPEEMATYMTYCRNLGFEETPNYAYLRRLFRELYNKCQFEFDFIYDWTIQKFRPELMDGPEGAENEEEKINNHGRGQDGTSTIPDSLRGNVHPGSDQPNNVEVMSDEEQKWAQK